MTSRAFDNYPIALYSNLMEWLQALSMRSAPVSQWIATIKSAKGIREDEIFRSGLLTFLDGFEKTDKVAKHDLLCAALLKLCFCFIKVRTERTVNYRPSLQSAAFASEVIPEKVRESFSDAEIISCHKLVSFNFRVVRLKFTDIFGSSESWYVFDECWNRFKPFISYTDPVYAIDFLYTTAAEKFKGYSSNSPENLYERYSLLGKNSSYKEWIVSIPDWKGSFNQSHFDLPNVILHLRTSVWKDIYDEPLFLIDEMQSDWHALGRKYGYYDIGTEVESDSDAVPDAPFKKEWHELGIKLAIWLALKAGYRKVAFTMGTVHQSRYGFDQDVFHLLYDQLIPKALEKLAAKFECSIETTMIAVSKPTASINYRRGLGWEIKNAGKDKSIKIIKNKEVALRYLKSRGIRKLEEVWVFEIPQTLLDVVKSKGLPMFGCW